MTVLRLAVLAPISGTEFGREAEQMVRGAALAADEIAAEADTRYPRFELVPVDTGSGDIPNVCRAARQVMGDHHLIGAVSGFASRTGFEIDILADAGIPYVLAEHSLEVQERIARAPMAYSATWGLMPSYDPYGTEPAPLLERISGEYLPGPGRRLFIASGTSRYSITCAERIATTFVIRGWDVVGGFRSDVELAYATDWSRVVNMVGESGADVLISTDYLPRHAAALAVAFAAARLPCLLMIQYGPKYPEFKQAAGPAANGVLYNVLGGPISALPATQAIVAGFRARYGEEPDRYAIDCYQSVRIFAAAVLRGASPTNREELGRAIGDVSLLGAEGQIVFDSATHLARAGDEFIPMRWYQVTPDEDTCLSPPSLAFGSFVRPPWL